MRILIVDTDPGTRWILRKALKGHTTAEVTSLEEARIILENETIDAVFTIRNLPDGESYNLIDRFQNTSFIIMTANPVIDNISLALKRGAFSYIKKPFDFNSIEEILEKIKHQQKRHKLETSLVIQNIHTVQAFKLIKRYIEESTPFLVLGETGVGKKTLVETALIQSQKNYTKLKTTKELVELDINKHIFVIIEPENLNLEEQQKITEFISQEMISFTPIFIMKEDPFSLLAKGKLTDYLFKIMTKRIVEIPPLRERKDEIPIFIEKIKNEINAKYSKSAPEISEEAMKAIINYRWPGNIKEFKEKIEALLKLEVPFIEHSHLPAEFLLEGREINSFEMLREDIKRLLGKNKNLYDTILNAVERILLEEALSFTQGNQVKAAQLIGIHRNTIRNKIKKLFGGKRYGSQRSH